MVENIIYYFSGTGNSLDIARHIASQLEDTILISMRENPYEIKLKSTKRVGFICPVYYKGLPNMVAHFMKHVRLTEDVYVFTVLTLHNHIGNAARQVNDLLEMTDYHLSYCNSIKMTNSNILEHSNQENNSKLLAGSYVQLSTIIREVQEYKTNSPAFVHPLAAFYHQMKMKPIQLQDMNYIVNDHCTHCGICRQICPNGNIDLADGRPIFLHHCESCMACIQFCPENAIDYKNVTTKRARYHHPNINAQDLM